MTEEKPLTRQEVVDIVVERMKAVSARTSVSVAPAQVFQYQTMLSVTTASPTTATAYEILPTTPNCRVISMAVNCTFASCDPLEIHVTIDGETVTYTTSIATTGTWNFPRKDGSSLDAAQDLTEAADDSIYYPFLHEGRSIRVQVEATGGTLSNLIGRVKYAKIP